MRTVLVDKGAPYRLIKLLKNVTTEKSVGFLDFAYNDVRLY